MKNLFWLVCLAATLLILWQIVLLHGQIVALHAQEPLPSPTVELAPPLTITPAPLPIPDPHPISNRLLFVLLALAMVVFVVGSILIVRPGEDHAPKSHH